MLLGPQGEEPVPLYYDPENPPPPPPLWTIMMVVIICGAIYKLVSSYIC